MKLQKKSLQTSTKECSFEHSFFIYISILKNNAIEAVLQLNMDKRSVYIILSEGVIYDVKDSMANYCSLTKEEFQITKNDIVLED